jgi:hypothetical protein
MKKTLAILSVIAVVSPSFAFAQANPNQGPTTGTESNKEQKERSQAGNAANPGPREYPGTDRDPKQRQGESGLRPLTCCAGA